MIELIMMSAVLFVLVYFLMAGKPTGRKVSPGEYREAEKKFRRERRNGPPALIPYPHSVSKPIFLAKQKVFSLPAHVKRYKNKEKWVHDWYRAHIMAYRHPRAVYSLMIFGAIVSYLSLISLFGDIAYGSIFGLVAPLASIQPYEMPNFGVDAEDWAKASGNYTDVEIQAAVDYARTNDKGLVYLTDNHNWEISNQIDITYTAVGTNYPGVHIMGAGMNNTILDATGLGAGEYVFSNDYNPAPDTRVQLLYYSDFRINGNSNPDGGIFAQYVGEGAAGGFFTERLEIQDFDLVGGTNGTGLRVEYIYRGSISTVNTSNCYQGIYLDHTNALPISNARTISGENGIVLKSSFANPISGCNSSGNGGSGITILRADENTVEYCYLENNDDYQVNVDRSDVSYTTSGNTVRKNYCQGLDNTSIAVRIHANSTIVEDNTFRRHTTASISLGTSARNFDTTWNKTTRNYSEDAVFVLIGANRVYHTVIEEKVYADLITDNGNYTIWPDNEYEIVTNNNPKAYGYVGSENAQVIINAVGEMCGQAITITEPVTVKTLKFTLRNQSGDTNFTIRGKIYGCTGTPGTDGTFNGSSALATSSNSFTGADLAAAGGAGNQMTFTFAPYILTAGNYVFAVEVTAHVNGGCEVRDDNTSPTGSGNLAYNVGSGPTYYAAVDCYNWELQDAGGSTTMEYGDVVVYDEAAESHVKHTTTDNDGKVAGVVYDVTTSQGDSLVILTSGPIEKVKVDGTTDITIGDYLSTFTTEGISQKGTVGSGTCYAIARGNYSTNDSNGEIPATIISVR